MLQVLQPATAWMRLLTILYLFRIAVAVVVDPIVIKGSHFFYQTNGSEFFLRGVVYQDEGHFVFNSTSFIDPFSDGPTCARDIPYLVSLRVNVVRVYAVNPSLDHSDCMVELAAAGIYVLAALSGAKSEIISGNAPEWNYDLYHRYTTVVDAFQNYTNVLGFIAGNEVVQDTQTSSSLAFVKAAIRDTKVYIKQNGYREIPVGYATSDIVTIQGQVADYLNCGDIFADFHGLNLYSWCGESSLQASGYSQVIAQYQNYSVPVFLSEYGCVVSSPRNFTEVQAIYGPNMTTEFSGGVVYQYYADDANYGLVTARGNSVSVSPDFKSLSSQIARISPSSTNSAQYAVTNTVQQACPIVGPSWSAAPTLPPTPYQRLCTCMMQSLGCIANSTASISDSLGSISSVCNLNTTACLGIATNATIGDYGAFTTCNYTEQVSWVLNQYYQSQNRAVSACGQVGGILQSPVTGSAVAVDCSIMLKQAGAVGAGTITSTPSPSTSATSGVSEPTGSGSGFVNSSGSITNSLDNSRSVLSGGTIAGIVIAVIIFVAIVCGTAVFLLKRQKAKRNGRANSKPDPIIKPELPDSQTATHAQGLIIDGEEVRPDVGPNMGPHELQGINYFTPVELDAQHGASEMSQEREGRL